MNVTRKKGENKKIIKMKIKNNNQMDSTESRKLAKGITLIALVITILFPYDEKLKCSNSKGFLLTTI